MKKLFMLFIDILFLIGLLYFTILNKANIQILMYIWGGFVIGIIFSSIANVIFKNVKDLNAYKNKYEKISVQSEEQSDKVKVLEEKVKSLEIALSKALNK